VADELEVTAASLTSDVIHLDHGTPSGTVHRRRRRLVDDQERPTEGQ
jgi:hypothetical protein